MTKDNKTGSFRGVFGCVANIDRKSGYKRQARLNRLNYSRYEAMPKNKPILGLTEGAGKGDIEQSIGENGAQGMTVGSVYRGKVAKCPAIPSNPVESCNLGEGFGVFGSITERRRDQACGQV